jgi:site-specific recombinase XerD
VYLGKAARRAVWRYLVEREDANDPDAPVFVAQNGHTFNPDSLRHIIKNIADRAGVKNAYPHKFRHTFGRSFGRLVNAL